MNPWLFRGLPLSEQCIRVRHCLVKSDNPIPCFGRLLQRFEGTVDLVKSWIRSYSFYLARLRSLAAASFEKAALAHFSLDGIFDFLKVTHVLTGGQPRQTIRWRHIEVNQFARLLVVKVYLLLNIGFEAATCSTALDCSVRSLILFWREVMDSHFSKRRWRRSGSFAFCERSYLSFVLRSSCAELACR